MKNILFLVILLFFGVDADAQHTSVKGKIINHHNEGIEGVEIYVNMKRIKASTNSRGKYRFKYPNKVQLITVYAPQYGFVNWNYKGEKKIDFVFPAGSEPVKKANFLALGYSSPVLAKEHEKNSYSNYSSILEILDHRFSEVQVNGNRILISRRGINAAYVEDPLILVNDIPTDIGSLETIPTAEVKSIRVITKGSDAAVYGYRGMNGVILVQLKTAKDRN